MHMKPLLVIAVLIFGVTAGALTPWWIGLPAGFIFGFGIAMIQGAEK